MVDIPAGFRIVSGGGQQIPQGFRVVQTHPEFDPANVPQRQPSRTTAMLSSFVEGVPVVGPYLQSGVENAASGLGSLLSGRPRSEVREEMGQMVDEAQQAHPIASTASGLGGAVAGTAPLVLAAPAAFGAGSAGLGIRTLASMASGGTLGLADSAVRSGGDTDAMKWGAGSGLVAGALGPAVAQGIGKGASYLMNRLSRNPPSAAQSSFARAAGADAVDDMAGQLSRMGPDAMPMDLGPNLQRQAGALAASPGRSQEIVRSSIAGRQANAGPRVTSALDATLGQPVDTLAVAEGIIARRSAAAKPLYDAAYRKPVPFTKELETLLKRPSVGRAMAQAQRLAADDETFNAGTRGWFANVADDGTVTISRTPSVYELDKTKQALDDMISTAQRAGNGNEARIYTQLKNNLTGMVDKAVPEYAKARAAFSGPSAVLNAMEEGQQVFSRNLTPNQLRTQMLKMGADEKDAFIQGARAEVAKIMGTARNDALAARSLFDKGWNKEKLEVVLGKQQAGKLLQSLDAEAAFTKSRDVVTGNSESAARLAAMGDVGANQRQPGMIRSALNMRFGDAVADMGDKAIAGARTAAQQRSNEELARLLTSRDPQSVTRVIQLVQAAQRRGDITAQRAREITQSLMIGGGTSRGRPLEITVSPAR